MLSWSKGLLLVGLIAVDTMIEVSMVDSPQGRKAVATTCLITGATLLALTAILSIK